MNRIEVFGALINAILRVYFGIGSSGLRDLVRALPKSCSMSSAATGINGPSVGGDFNSSSPDRGSAAGWHELHLCLGVVASSKRHNRSSLEAGPIVPVADH